MKGPLYVAWVHMRQRCNNPRNADYKHYGGRGICVSSEWSSFAAFERDMGESYQSGLEIERIDNDGPYSKANCRWATRREQVNNTRRCHRLTWRGRTLNITQWSEALGVPRGRLKDRITRLGWSVERALTEGKQIN